MATKGTSIEIMITGKAATAPAVAQAIADVNRLSAAGASANQRIASLTNSLSGMKGVKVQASFKEFIPDAQNAARATGDVTKEIDKLNEAFISFNRFTSRAFAVGAVIGGIVGVGAAVYSLAEGAQKFDILGTSYETMAKKIGANSAELMAALRGVSQGMISDADLMLTANQAVMLSVVQSQDDMTKLMQVAMARGQAMGLDPTQAFGDLVRGIGRLSPLILDNLGIVTDAKNTYAAYATQIGKTVEALTPMEKKQALLNRVFKESADVLATPIRENPFAQLQASLSNLSLQLGAGALPEVTEMFGNITDAANTAAEMIARINILPEEEKAYGLGREFGLSFAKGIKDALANNEISVEPPNFVFKNQLTEGVEGALSGALEGMLAKSASDYENDIANAQAKIAQLTADMARAQREYGPDVARDENFTNAIQEQNNLLESANVRLRAIMQERAAIIKDSLEGLKVPKSAMPLDFDFSDEQVKDILKPLEERNKAYQSLRDSLKSTFVNMVPDVGAEEAMRQYADAMRDLTEAAGEMAGISTEDLPFFNAEFLDKYKNPPEMNTTKLVDDAMQQFNELAQQMDKAVGTGKTTDYLDSVRHALTQMIPAWKAQGQSIDYIANVSMPNFIASLQQVGERAMASSAWMDGFRQSLNANEQALLTQTKLVYDLSAALGSLATKTGPMVSKSNVLDMTNSRINAMTPQIINERGMKDGLKWAEDQKRAASELYDEYKALGYTTTEIEMGLTANLDTTQKWVGSLDNVGQKVSDAEKEFNKLRDSVRGVLDEALSLSDVGFDPNDAQTLEDAGLPRPDVINENARRLAAIAKEGFKDQSWMEEFKREVPGVFQELAESGDPRAAAAAMLRSFQDGLRPELIDKDMAKKRVKDMLLGDANMAAMAEEIAAEIANEMSMSVPEAMAATKEALGLADKTSTMTPGKGLEEGLANATDGASLIEGIAKKMEEAYTRMKTAGEGAGRQWGTGFMATVESGIAQPLIDLLVKLVTPGVLATINAQNTQNTPP